MSEVRNADQRVHKYLFSEILYGCQEVLIYLYLEIFLLLLLLSSH